MAKKSSYTIKSLLFELIPAASAAAKERYPKFSQRDLYYNCRNKYLTHPERPYHREYMIKREKGETEEQYEARRARIRQTRSRSTTNISPPKSSGTTSVSTGRSKI
jgi:hypothetical protein